VREWQLTVDADYQSLRGCGTQLQDNTGDVMLSDLRSAVRALSKAPFFAAVAALILAVAIGACTTLFSVLEGAILSPLPYKQADSLVSIWSVDRARNVEEAKISRLKADFLRERKDIFADLALLMPGSFAVAVGAAEPVDLVGLRISTNYLHVLGLTPIRGRFFSEEDGAEGAAGTVVISNSLWKGRFAGDPDIIGRSIEVNHVPSRIIGVLPAQIGVAVGQGTVLNRTDILIPLSDAAIPLPAELRAMAPVYQAVARLASGVGLQQAQVALTAAAQQFKQSHPGFPDAATGSELRTLKQQLIGNLGQMLWILGGVVTAVLLIACANVANLFLARASARWGDIVIRQTLGATRPVIVRQYLAEAMVLSLAAAAFGVLFAWGGTKAIVAEVGYRLPRPDEIGINAIVLAFSVGLALLCTVIIALYPAWHASRLDVQSGLQHANRAVAGNRATRFFRGALVVIQVQVSVALLTCTCLLALSFYHLQTTDPGFGVESRAFGYVNLPAMKYSTADVTRSFFEQLDERLQLAPELVAGGAISGMPLSGSVTSMAYAAQDRPLPPAQERPTATAHVVTPGYFHVMGIQLREGRFFTRDDHVGGQGTVIINETLAKALYPHSSALNRSLLAGNADGAGLQIVGVVRDAKTSGLAASAGPEIYFPHAQLLFGLGTMTIVGQAKPGLQAGAVIPVLRRVLAQLDPTLILMYPQTVRDLVSHSLEIQGITLVLLLCFSAIALLLAAVGIYSVLAYSVGQRTTEIGIRMALGARQRQVVLHILRQGMQLVGTGLIIGLAVSVAMTRLIQSMLYQVEPLDPLILGSITALFALTGALACLVPSLRASRVDPQVALRME
jgi:predicted permease